MRHMSFHMLHMLGHFDGSVTATPDVHEDINAKVLYMCDCCFRYMCIMDLHAVHH